MKQQKAASIEQALENANRAISRKHILSFIIFTILCIFTKWYVAGIVGFLMFLIINAAHINTQAQYLWQYATQIKQFSCLEHIFSKVKFPLTDNLLYNYAFFTGQNERALYYASKSAKSNPFSYMITRAQIYFLNDEEEKLKIAVESYEKELPSAKHPEKIKEKYPCMEFFRYYLNKDYENCVAYCNRTMQLPADYPFSFSNISLKLGVSYYKLGDMENAKTHFQKVVEATPELCYATVANLYLQAIENGESPALTPTGAIEDATPIEESPYIINKGAGYRMYIGIIIFLLCQIGKLIVWNLMV